MEDDPYFEAMFEYVKTHGFRALYPWSHFATELDEEDWEAILRMLEEA
jgi:hypothetical protein